MKKIIIHTLAGILAFGGATVALAQTEVQANVRVERAGAKLPPPAPMIKKALENRKEVLAGQVASSSVRTQEAKKQTEDARGRMMGIEPNRATSTRTMEIKGEMEKKRLEMMQQQYKHQFDKMSERFEATIAREEAILEKINSRISKIKAEGGKTEAAEKLVATAKNHLAEARTSYEALKIAVGSASVSISGSTTTINKDAIKNMRESAGNIEKHLREAHNALLKTVGILRGVSELHATSTAEVRI